MSKDSKTGEQPIGLKYYDRVVFSKLQQRFKKKQVVREVWSKQFDSEFEVVYQVMKRSKYACFGLLLPGFHIAGGRFPVEDL